LNTGDNFLFKLDEEGVLMFGVRSVLVVGAMNDVSSTIIFSSKSMLSCSTLFKFSSLSKKLPL